MAGLEVTAEAKRLELAVGAIVYVVEVYAWRTARSAQFVKKHILRRRLASRLR